MKTQWAQISIIIIVIIYYKLFRWLLKDRFETQRFVKKSRDKNTNAVTIFKFSVS